MAQLGLNHAYLGVAVENFTLICSEGNKISDRLTHTYTLLIPLLPNG